MLNRNGRKERNTVLLIALELIIINIFYLSYIIVIYLLGQAFYLLQQYSSKKFKYHKECLPDS